MASSRRRSATTPTATATRRAAPRKKARPRGSPAAAAIDWSALARIVAPRQRFLLTSHVRPDCDALGSELGLAIGLAALGKQATIVNADATPPHLRFLDAAGRIKALGVDAAADELRRAEAVIVLDTSAWNQLGEMADVVRGLAAPRVVIDHHVSGDDLGATVLKDTACEATGRLVLSALDALGVPLSAEIATPLLAAVATDTGWFRFPSTTAETFRVAARLVEAGAAPAAVYAAIYEQRSLARLKLMGRILQGARTELGGRLIVAEALADDFAATGAAASDTEDVINALLTVGGGQAAVLLVQLAPRRVKASFRSRGPLDCSAVAERFEGGGHRAAAGATIDGTPAAVRRRVLDAVRRAMR